MTFKEYQLYYIEQYKEEKPVDYPKTMFDDLQEIYDMFKQQLDAFTKELKQADKNKLSAKDRIELIKAIDDCNNRMYNIIQIYKQQATACKNYNHFAEKGKVGNMIEMQYKS